MTLPTRELELSDSERALSKKLTDWTYLGEGSWFIVGSGLTTDAGGLQSKETA